MTPLEILIVSVGAGAVVGAGWAVLRRRRRRIGAPDEEVIDDTEPLTPDRGAPGALILCPHGISLARRCDRCDAVLRGKHVTLDDDDPKGAA